MPAYNKSTIQEFQRQLNIRRKALPVLLRKETALRQVLKSFKAETKAQREKTAKLFAKLKDWEDIWNDFTPMVQVEEVQRERQNVAGTKVWSFKGVIFKDVQFNPRYEPAWMPAALEALQEYLRARLQLESMEDKLRSLEEARKKTTQKVNLYEKVQIPEYEESIRRIKRFLEDKQNIATAAMKIVKNRNEAA